MFSHLLLFVWLSAKMCQAGEDSLRRSGLGYTIIRPGPLKVTLLWVLANVYIYGFDYILTNFLRQEEPGGQRALIFDQGNRISQVSFSHNTSHYALSRWTHSTPKWRNLSIILQGISCADVADICVKSLHDSTARNKSFDVSCSLHKSSWKYDSAIDP